METTRVYKVTAENGEAHIANNGFMWPLPVGKRPGKWVHAEGPLKECKNGLHACRSVLDIGYHMNSKGFTVWFADAKGECIEGDNKTAFRSLRLARRSKWDKYCAAMFAADCAERALINSKWNDSRSWNAVSISRNVALQLIAESAAWSARSAAESAAWSAWSARSAAWSAAESARSAARSAAWSAADSAAESARSAARSAADSAADSAAWSAAWSAEKEWQEERLLQYLEHGIDAYKMECAGWKSTRGLANEGK